MNRNRLACFAFVMSLLVGCATAGPRLSDAGLEEIVKGPGNVFSSVEDAAADALAWCYLLSKQARVDRFRGQIRAGVITPVEGGYTYAGIEIAHPQLQSVRIALAPSDVAHFRLYPSANDFRNDRDNSRHSRADRHVVDVVDPLHRSSYLMTPGNSVRVYAGGGEEWVLGHISDWAQQTPRWGRHPTVTVTNVVDAP